MWPFIISDVLKMDPVRDGNRFGIFINKEIRKNPQDENPVTYATNFREIDIVRARYNI